LKALIDANPCLVVHVNDPERFVILSRFGLEICPKGYHVHFGEQQEPAP